jgi:hypothetical protein
MSNKFYKSGPFDGLWRSQYHLYMTLVTFLERHEILSRSSDD